MRLFATLFFILTISFCSACSCRYVRNFDLGMYDASTNIFELTITSKVSSDYTRDTIKYREESKNWDKPYPQPPPPPPPLYQEFNAEIKTIYKGNLTIDAIVLRSSDTSCKWTPIIKESYLVYLGEFQTDKENKYISINACNRKIRQDSEYIIEERKILNRLRDKKDGEFIFYQSLEEIDNDDQLHLLSGQYFNGKRDGNWIFSEPLNNAKNILQSVDSMLIITYNEDEVENVIFNYPREHPGRGRWIGLYLFYYDKVSK